ncbi:MAG TPA: LLM class flavin-dependent oxidoreductase [Acidimicrobiales bacterium]|nr:LLM class flavin-dependent oxidoreductase [Acidimicrobiales bacterium]
MVEVWTAGAHVAGTAGAVARAAERDGFDGISFGDTQHIAADPFGGLCVAARETTRLGLMVGVTNPVTRHPAVSAAAIATVQVESGGRAILGIGRGDSALGHLGRPPAPVAVLEDYLDRLQGYLAGETVDADGYPSQIPWIARTGQPKVPVDVAATGPRMLALGAARAERVTVNVGAEPARVAWALEVARRARASSPGAGRPVSLGAYLVVAAHPDAAVARDLVRGPLAAYAHFSGMPGSPRQLLSADDRAVVEAVTADYDLSGHGQRSARHVAHLDDAFVERFGVAGTPEHCVGHLGDLVDLGLDRLVVVEGRDAAAPGAQRTAHRVLVDEVLPALAARAPRD